jgi:hypothetical protein
MREAPLAREAFRNDPVLCVRVENVLPFEGSQFSAVTLTGSAVALCEFR